MDGRDASGRVQVEAAVAGELVVDAGQVAVGAVGVGAVLDACRVLAPSSGLVGQAAGRVPDVGEGEVRVADAALGLAARASWAKSSVWPCAVSEVRLPAAS